MTLFGDFLFETVKGDETDQFGVLLDDQSRDRLLVLDGQIATYGERLIYVPYRFPVILQFNLDGSMVYARSTLDRGNVETPEMEGIGGRDRRRLPGYGPAHSQ